jgi:hypothetical protein
MKFLNGFLHFFSMITWWHVYNLSDKKAWGFSSKDGVVINTPYEHNYIKSKKLPDIRTYFINCIVSKVGDLCM